VDQLEDEMKIFLVDDEASIRLGVGDALRNEGFDVELARNGEEAWLRLNRESFDVVLSDVRMPQLSGRNLMRRAVRRFPQTDFVLMTGYATIQDAVEAVKSGATDYLAKPVETETLLTLLRKITERRRLAGRLINEHNPETAIADRLQGSHPTMTALRERIVTFAQSNATVLITGETGTGKELVARALHDKSSRQTGPFIAINSSAFPDTLIDAELFGHEKGSFTGALKKRSGRFQAAHGGTLFLDEIGELPTPAQAKLLRALQESQVYPIGSDQPVNVDVRVLAATNRDLKSLVASGGFREDLYYRLKVLHLRIPPLRNRRSDIPSLCRFFLREFQDEGEQQELSSEAWATLLRHDFPGNVRELRHAVQHARIVAAGRTIEAGHWPEDITGELAFNHQGKSTEGVKGTTLAQAVNSFEQDFIQQALQQTNGQRTKAAKVLGISRKSLWEKLKRAEAAEGIDSEDF
jgi:DNA-binding NtrC family response regulator